MNFNEQIAEKLPNEFGGSGRKKTVVLKKDGRKYMLKFPNPIRNNGKVSYDNSVFSEYVGCMVAKSIGIPAQDVILGEYTFENGKTTVACACGDVRRGGEILYEIYKLQLGWCMDNDSSKDSTFESALKIFDTLGKHGLDRKELEEFYFDMFVLDALVGNTSRSGEDWGILKASNGSVRIAPVYGLGSSLYPAILDGCIERKDVVDMALGTYSAIKDNHLRRINYHEIFTEAKDERVNIALKRVFPRIKIDEIYSIINNTPYISEERKMFYKEFVRANYVEILMRGMEKIA